MAQCSTGKHRGQLNGSEPRRERRSSSSGPNSSVRADAHSVTSKMPDRLSSTPWLDVQGAAARALCSDGTILREARAGRLRGYKLGGRRCWRFRAEDVDVWLTQKTELVEYMPHLRDVGAR